MRELQLRELYRDRNKQRANSAYIVDFDETMMGQYIFIDRNWNSPVLGKIIDKYSFLEEDSTQKAFAYVRNFQRDFKVYLINDFEVKVYRL